MRCISLFKLIVVPAAIVTGLSVSEAAIPFNSAKISRIENQVSIGEIKNGETTKRRAAVDDIVRASNFLQTEIQSRAELRFEDNTIVRVGQNSIFTFEAASRTLDLKKGTMLFYVPPGQGGGNIKTPTLTAAITGTLCKVTETMIAVLHGQLTTPWGVVEAGYAIENVNGEVRIFKFDPAEATKGKLYSFGGELPETPDAIIPLPGDKLAGFIMDDLHQLDLLEITQINPRVNDFLENPPDKPEKKTKAPKPKPTPTPTAKPTPTPTPPQNY